MALRAASPLAPFWFEPLDEDGNTQGVKFQLKGLKALDLFDVNAAAIHSEGTVKWTSASVRLGLRMGLVGWEGLLDNDGNPVPFEKSIDNNISRLSWTVMSQLFGQILDASQLGVEQEKN
ncbi:MAG: hypothetical protein ACOY9J_03445 [Pseudomonadota bacterium]